MIESRVAQIADKEAQGQIIGNLRDDGHTTAYHELVVGELLERAHCQVEYSPRLLSKDEAALTPDWIITLPSGGKAIVEVVTLEAPQDRVKPFQQYGRICDCIARLPHPYLIGLSSRTDYDEMTLDDLEANNDSSIDDEFLRSNTPKKVARAIDQWLKTEPPMGSRLRVIGGYAKIIAQHSSKNGCICIPPVDVFTVDDLRPSKSIKGKFAKYADLAERDEIGYIIAIVTEAGSGHDAETLQMVLHGNPRASLQLHRDDKGQEKVVIGEWYQGDDGLLRPDRTLPELSGVLVIEAGGLDMAVNYIPNPYAARPVELDALPNHYDQTKPR